MISIQFPTTIHKATSSKGKTQKQIPVFHLPLTQTQSSYHGCFSKSVSQVDINARKNSRGVYKVVILEAP